MCNYVLLLFQVSVNVPYQRFLAGLMPSFNAFGEEFASSFARRLASHGDIFHLVRESWNEGVVAVVYSDKLFHVFDV